MEAENKIKAIAEFILAYKPKDSEESNNYNGNLFTGKAGVALFLFYYGQQFGCERSLEKANEILFESVDFINSVEDGKFDPTFCQGISGILWTIDHLIKQRFIESSNGEMLNYFDEFLTWAMNLMIEANNLDFLHGPIGTGIYLLKRTCNPTVVYGLTKAIEQLNDKKIRHRCGFYWKHKIGNFPDEDACNLSLSHGMTGMMLFLSKAVNENINTEMTSQLLKEAIEFTLNQELTHKNRKSMFPSYCLSSKENLRKANISRLGWCYGDLGIGVLLKQAGEQSSNKMLTEKSSELFQLNCRRRNLKHNYIIDAGICHGTAGIALIFRRLYLESRNHLYKETSEYWLQQTLAQATHKQGYCGYMADEHHPSLALLEGIAGIGLVLLSFVTDEKPEWDELLLLS